LLEPSQEPRHDEITSKVLAEKCSKKDCAQQGKKKVDYEKACPGLFAQPY